MENLLDFKLRFRRRAETQFRASSKFISLASSLIPGPEEESVPRGRNPTASSHAHGVTDLHGEPAMSPAPPQPQSRGRVRPWLAVGDLVLSALWVCAGALVKLAVYGALGLGGRPEGDAVKVALSIAYMFVFAWLESATGGASYNPLTALAAALASGGGPAVYLFTAFVRIPTQVVGAVLGVNLIQLAFPSVGKGARLSVGAHHGALAEGLATFLVVTASVTLKKMEIKSFFMKTWMTSIWKNTIHILSTDISGGIMNPASAFAWAYARGDHSTFDHLLVYWLAPLQATLLGVWVVTFLTKPKKIKEPNADNKRKNE